MIGSNDSELCLHFYEKNSQKIKGFRLEIWTTFLGVESATISGIFNYSAVITLVYLHPFDRFAWAMFRVSGPKKIVK